MSDCIMVGCDLHDRSMLLKVARGREAAQTQEYETVASEQMLERLKGLAQGARVVLAYEASAQGYRLYDAAAAAGVECYVLAPTRIPHTVRSRKSKCDGRDAQRILEVVRGHVLAGNEMPAVWVPDARVRDDRELVRARLEATEKTTRIRSQIRTLLKRYVVSKPAGLGKGFSQRQRGWLRSLVTCEGTPLGVGAQCALGSLLAQWEAIEAEKKKLDLAIAQLGASERYERLVRELCTFAGVGVLTALGFLTELGDMNRFRNRRQLGAYLGVVPCSDDSAEVERKGHITHQGSPRVRKLLCQAVWNRIRTDQQERVWYQQLVQRNPKHKKVAVVAGMRRLAIRMWHRALEVQACAVDPFPPSRPPQGGSASPRHWQEKEAGASP